MKRAELLWSVWLGALAIECFASLALAQAPSFELPWQQQAFPGAFSSQRMAPRIVRSYLLSFRWSKRSADLCCVRSAAFHTCQRSPARFATAPVDATSQSGIHNS
jgi:hypothetical protein